MEFRGLVRSVAELLVRMEMQTSDLVKTFCVTAQKRYSQNVNETYYRPAELVIVGIHPDYRYIADIGN